MHDLIVRVLTNLQMLLLIKTFLLEGFPGGSAGKESSCKAGDLGLIPGLGRSPGKGNGYPLQYSGLEKSMDYIVHGVTKSQARLNNFHFLFWNKYVCLVCGKLTSNGIKLNLWKFHCFFFHQSFKKGVLGL